MDEKMLQAVIMRRCLFRLQHQTVLPNDTTFYNWEADLLTINRSGFISEFECKISIADFRKDSQKRKFLFFEKPSRQIPNYFWYVTGGDFDIQPPIFAGWIKVNPDPKHIYRLSVIKPAPRLHKEKPNQAKVEIAARLLSFKLANIYFDQFVTQHKQGETHE